MSKEKRHAGNMEYKDFLTSVKDEKTELIGFKLEIPEFQRNYVWKSSHIEDLFNSLKDNSNNYYLGNVVIVRDSDRKKLLMGNKD